MASPVLNLAVVLRAVDRLTGPVQRARQAVDGLKGSAEGLNRLQGAGRGLLAAGGAAVGALGLAVKASADFQSAMVGVQKTTGFSNQEIKKLSGAFLDLSTTMPQSALELAQIGEVGGQLGITGVDNVRAFTEQVAMLASVTDLTAETGGEAIAKLANQFKLPITQAFRMGSVLNEMSNVSTATAGDIADLANRMAGAGHTAGFTMPQIAGLGAVLKDLGVSNEVAGTAMSDMFLEMMRKTDEFGRVAGLSGAQFKQAMQKDALGALQLFLNGLKGMDKFEVAGILGDLGLEGSRSADVLLKLADATRSTHGEASLLAQRLQEADTAFREGTSLQKEFETGMGAMNNKFKVLRNSAVALAIQLADKLTPVLVPLIDKIKEVIDKISQWTKNNPEATQKIVKLAAALAGLSVAAGGVLSAAAGLGALGAAMAGLPAMGAALGAVGAAISSAFLPVIGIVAAVAAVAGILWLVWTKNLGGFRTQVLGLVNTFQTGFKTITDVLRGAFALFRGEQLSPELEKSLNSKGLMDAARGVANVFSTVWEFVKNAGKSAAGVLGPAVAGAVQAVRGLLGNIGPILGSVFSAFGGGGGGLAGGAKVFGAVLGNLVVRPLQLLIKLFTWTVQIISFVVKVFFLLGQAIGAAAFYVVSFVQKAVAAWNTLKGAAANLWTTIKGLFSRGLAFLSSINWAAAGRKIIDSLVKGITGGAAKVVGAIKGVAQRIRNHLPFSPAREGPLRDITRIRLVETLAETVRPAPLVARMASVMGQVATLPRPQPPPRVLGGAARVAGQARVAGGGVTVHYNPVITLQGEAGPQAREQFAALLRAHKDDLLRVLAQAGQREARLAF